MNKNLITIAFFIFVVLDAVSDGYQKWKSEKEYKELEQGCRDLMELVRYHHTYADSMIKFGIVKSPVLLNMLEAGVTYEITPDSSTRRYWLIVEPDTTEFSNPK